MDKCVICQKEIGAAYLIIRKNSICLDCQRDIAGAYANTHLDPIELCRLIDKKE